MYLGNWHGRCSSFGYPSPIWWVEMGILRRVRSSTVGHMLACQDQPVPLLLFVHTSPPPANAPSLLILKYTHSLNHAPTQAVGNNDFVRISCTDFAVLRTKSFCMTSSFDVTRLPHAGLCHTSAIKENFHIYYGKRWRRDRYLKKKSEYIQARGGLEINCIPFALDERDRMNEDQLTGSPFDVHSIIIEYY